MNINKKFFIPVGVICVFILAWLILPKKDKESANSFSSGESVQVLYSQALNLKDHGQLLEAKAVYQRIVSEYSSYEKIEAVEKELEDLNFQIIFSNIQTPETVIREVQNGDTLGNLAKEYGTTVEFIKRSNYLKSDTIRVGQKLRIWTGSFNIFVDKSQNILILKDKNEVVKVYRVSTGQNNSTPIGTFKITSKLVDPVWYNKGIVVPPESPQNVLGTRWLGFDLPGYGIHGTVDPEKIGQQATAGCVRMLNKDVEELYTLVSIGTSVVIVD